MFGRGEQEGLIWEGGIQQRLEGDEDIAMHLSGGGENILGRGGDSKRKGS